MGGFSYSVTQYYITFYLFNPCCFWLCLVQIKIKLDVHLWKKKDIPSLVLTNPWGGGGGGVAAAWGDSFLYFLGFLGVLSFLKSWPSPLAKQKQSMTLPKRSPKNVTLPVSRNPSWYYSSLLTGCLRIVAHCHNTVAKRWISLSLYVIKLISNFVLPTLWTKVTYVFWTRSAPLSISIVKENAVALTMDVLKRCD